MADLTYVYCIVKSDKAAPALGRAPKGLPKTKGLRLLDLAGGWHAVAANAPEKDFSAEAIETRLRDLEWVGACGAAHEAVVEHAATLGTVVPMKLFTLFAGDARAIAHLGKTKKALDRIATRIGGCDEWGVRVLFDESRAAAAKTPAKQRPASGTSFLQRKKEQADERRHLAANARAEVEELYDGLERVAKRAVRRAPPNQELAGSVLLDAVFLVPRKSTRTFKTTAAAIAKELAKGGHHVTLTGPWPAYSFVEGR